MLTDLVRGGALTGDLNTRFLNTNNANLTNIFAHGFLSFNRSRISFFYTHTDFYLLIAHGSHGSFTLEFFEHESHELNEFFACGSFCVFLYARGFYSVFYTHTDLTLFLYAHGSHGSRILFAAGRSRGGHEIFLNTRFAVGPLTEGR